MKSWFGIKENENIALQYFQAIVLLPVQHEEVIKFTANYQYNNYYYVINVQTNNTQFVM